jgi:hypothetical protein
MKPRVSPTSLFVAKIAEAPRRPAWMAADAEVEEDLMVDVVVVATAEAPWLVTTAEVRVTWAVIVPSNGRKAAVVVEDPATTAVVRVTWAVIAQPRERKVVVVEGTHVVP